MSDFEILDKYIKDMKLDNDISNLCYQEQILYKCQLRDTFSFSVYLCRYRILELLDIIMSVITER